VSPHLTLGEIDLTYLLNLHRLAAARGDGLLPALRDLLESRAEIARASPMIEDMADYREGTAVQAGPFPHRRFDPVRAGPGIIPFPAAGSTGRAIKHATR
jgi:hypothetical protein